MDSFRSVLTLRPSSSLRVPDPSKPSTSSKSSAADRRPSVNKREMSVPPAVRPRPTKQRVSFSGDKPILIDPPTEGPIASTSSSTMTSTAVTTASKKERRSSLKSQTRPAVPKHLYQHKVRVFLVSLSFFRLAQAQRTGSIATTIETKGSVRQGSRSEEGVQRYRGRRLPLWLVLVTGQGRGIL